MPDNWWPTQVFATRAGGGRIVALTIYIPEKS